MANDTIYGFEVRYLDFARMLMKEGITPHELKEHYHDFEWISNILHKQYDAILQEQFDKIREDFYENF